MLPRLQTTFDRYVGNVGYAEVLMTGDKMWTYITTVREQEGDYAAAIAFQYMVTTRTELFGLKFYAEALRGKHAYKSVVTQASKSFANDLKYLDEKAKKYQPFKPSSSNDIPLHLMPESALSFCHNTML